DLATEELVARVQVEADKVLATGVPPVGAVGGDVFGPGERHAGSRAQGAPRELEERGHRDPACRPLAGEQILRRRGAAAGLEGSPGLEALPLEKPRRGLSESRARASTSENQGEELDVGEGARPSSRQALGALPVGSRASGARGRGTGGL